MIGHLLRAQGFLPGLYVVIKSLDPGELSACPGIFVVLPLSEDTRVSHYLVSDHREPKKWQASHDAVEYVGHTSVLFALCRVVY